MKLARVEVHTPRIALRRRLWHAAASRTFVDPIFVVAHGHSDAVGNGETLARPYLTGETVASVRTDIERWAASLIGVEGSTESWLATLRAMSEEADRDRRTAAFCALELAILDLLSREDGCPIGALFGIPLAETIAVTLPVLDDDIRAVRRADVVRRACGFGEVKVKIGAADDLARVSVFRGSALSVDANGAFTRAQCIESIRPLLDAGVSLVEQPLAAGDREGLATVESTMDVAVCADESLCTRRDAEELLSRGSCSTWNLRLAKNGGLINTLHIGAIARSRGIRVHVGALVGESSVLAAAGLWLASAFPDRRSFEGGYGTRILAHDPVRPPIVADGTIAPRLESTGLGVCIDTRALAALPRAMDEGGSS